MKTMRKQLDSITNNMDSENHISFSPFSTNDLGNINDKAF
jgi:hypothetical protein